MLRSLVKKLTSGRSVSQLHILQQELETKLVSYVVVLIKYVPKLQLSMPCNKPLNITLIYFLRLLKYVMQFL